MPRSCRVRPGSARWRSTLDLRERCLIPLTFRMVTSMTVLHIREQLTEPMPWPRQPVRLSRLAVHSSRQAPRADPQRVRRSLFGPPGVWSVPCSNIPCSAFFASAIPVRTARRRRSAANHGATVRAIARTFIRAFHLFETMILRFTIDRLRASRWQERGSSPGGDIGVLLDVGFARQKRTLLRRRCYPGPSPARMPPQGLRRD
jgi:hypothetical protein